MGSKRRTEITLKARQTLVIRSRPERRAVWCAECARPSQMLTPEEASEASGLGQRELFRRVEAGRIHYRETGGGRPLVCLASLAAEILSAGRLEF